MHVGELELLSHIVIIVHPKPFYSKRRHIFKLYSLNATYAGLFIIHYILERCNFKIACLGHCAVGWAGLSIREGDHYRLCVRLSLLWCVAMFSSRGPLAFEHILSFVLVFSFISSTGYKDALT